MSCNFFYYNKYSCFFKQLLHFRHYIPSKLVNLEKRDKRQKVSYLCILLVSLPFLVFCKKNIIYYYCYLLRFCCRKFKLLAFIILNIFIKIGLDYLIYKRFELQDSKLKEFLQGVFLKLLNKLKFIQWNQ